VVEAVSFRVRPAVESDLKALEWEGEYARFRRVYRRAMDDTRRNRRLILVAEAAGQVVGQIFAQYQSTHRPLGCGHAATAALRVRPAFPQPGIGSG
jgi:predicted N-acetyltransferase YhbS